MRKIQVPKNAPRLSEIDDVDRMKREFCNGNICLDDLINFFYFQGMASILSELFIQEDYRPTHIVRKEIESQVYRQAYNSDPARKTESFQNWLFSHRHLESYSRIPGDLRCLKLVKNRNAK